MQHISYFSLVRLASSLQQLQANEGLVLSDCFSQNKDELILEFCSSTASISWRVRCAPDFPFILPEPQLKRARQNSITLFEDALQVPIEHITVPTNERCILFSFENQLSMLIKMFGKHANVLLFETGKVVDCFRKKIANDWEVQLPTCVQVPILIHDQQLKQHLNSRIKQGVPAPEATQQIIQECFASSVFLLRQPADVQFWLVRPNLDGELKTFLDFQAGLEAFVREKFRVQRFSTLYQQTISTLAREKKRLESRIRDSENQLSAMNECSYELLGNLILAHLPQILPKQTVLSVWNFEGTKQIDISLNLDVDALGNAQRYFQKNKRQRIQLERLNNQLDTDLSRLWDVEAALKEAEHSTTAPMLKSLQARYTKLFQANSHVAEAEALPFRKYEYAGYTIWVGKNAAANDKMTVQYAHKDDLWLHARDVSGSHVIIRRIPGRSFPTSAIEYAAGLALHFSKNKNAGLSPVSYTPKKYVRKHKKHLPGQVTLEREAVILVLPLAPKHTP